MKFVVVILLISLGTLLIALTEWVDDIGRNGNFFMHIIGVGCIVGAIMVIRTHKKAAIIGDIF